MSARQFFRQIFRDLYYDFYLALGGSLEDEALNWTWQAKRIAATTIKVAILLGVLGLLYWLTVYAIKHNRWTGKKSRYFSSWRLFARLLWLFSSVLAVMSQLSVEPDTIKASVKAGVWSVLFYLLWYNLGYIMQQMLKDYGLNASIKQLLHNLLSVLIIVLWLASVMAQFGFDIVSVVAGLGIAGIAVGFAAQSTLANFISGINILIEQSFQVGDWVKINDNEGKVVEIALRTTKILTRDNITVIVPNSSVASSVVINLTSKNLIRFDIEVRIALEQDIEAAREVMMAVLTQEDALSPRPAPLVTVDHIGDFGVYFIVRFWVAPPQVARLPVLKEQLREKIKRAFDDAGIATPYPHMQLIAPVSNLRPHQLKTALPAKPVPKLAQLKNWRKVASSSKFSGVFLNNAVLDK